MTFLPHVDPPATNEYERLCVCGDEDYDGHRITNRDQIVCTAKGCGCKEFRCWQHPDGGCFDDDVPSREDRDDGN